MQTLKLMELKHKFNLYRRYLHWSKNKCIFIHVPKVAGTSINHAIYGRTLGHYSSLEINNTFPQLFQKSFVFSLVRNPWDRVLSAYRFAKQGRTETMGVNNPEQYQIPEFATFESFVLEWLADKNVDELDFVFQTQSRFLVDEKGELLPDYVGKLESLEESVPIIDSKLGRKLAIPHANKVNKKGSYHDYYTSQKMIDVVSEKYAEDIKRFEYIF
ncbi:sulfotransferase family 2 domain-containing protein [Shewanella sp. 10N.286.54.B9]|uniref:sulfotransferase family 2 domain-containing protein n=1 Tax=Shewanella sp. 10N.286.54.B9 TaxID=3229719 RepID=UPI00354CDA5F